MDHLLELFHSEHDDDILDVDLQMLQYWLVVAPSSKHLQSLLCYIINMEDRMLLSQIACRTFPCFSQPRPLCISLMETRDMPKELRLFYVVLLTVPLFICWYQFIILQVVLPTPSHKVP